MVARRRLSFTANRSNKRARVTPAQVRKIIRNNAEFKFHDVQGPFVVSNTTGINTDLSLIATGSNFDQRVGNKITMTRLDIQMLCRNTEGMRLIIYCPKAPDATIPNTTGLNAPVDNNKFWIWHDEIYAPMGIVAGDIPINLKFNKTMNILFDGGAGSALSRNPIRMYFTSVDQTANTARRVDGITKLWYKDA